MEVEEGIEAQEDGYDVYIGEKRVGDRRGNGSRLRIITWVDLEGALFELYRGLIIRPEMHLLTVT